MDENVIPTKSNLLASKHTLGMSQLGYDLLDRKRSVLINEIMSLYGRARDIQARIDATFAEAYQALQAANISMGISEVWRLSLGTPADDSIRVRERSVMGVLVPTVTAREAVPDTPDFQLVGTSSTLDIAFIKFHRVKGLILELAMVETAVYRLAVAIRKAQKRANALKNIIIPRYERAVKYIAETLEERERDEFVRLKVIKKGAV